MKTVTLVVFVGRDRDLRCVFGAANSVGRRVGEVYYDPSAKVFDALLQESDNDFFIVGSPSADRFDLLRSAFKEVIGCRFANGRLIAYFADEGFLAVTETVKEIKKLLSFDEKRFAFKLYGERADRLEDITAKIAADNFDVEICFAADKCDILCDIIVKKGYSPERLDITLKTFIKEFSASIYADEDVDLYERFSAVMKLYGRKLSVAESMTGGNIAGTLIKISGASDIFYEGLVTYDTRAKFRRLGVLPETVAKNTVVSAEVAYEMVKSLVNGNSSVGISVTGYAPSVNKNKNDGLCFIGVAVDQKIKVYRFVFSGDRKTVIEKACGAAVFSALKLLTESFFVN